MVVALDGPPFVISQIISKTLNESNVPTNPKTKSTFFKLGKVIYQNSLKILVPSIFEAS